MLSSEQEALFRSWIETHQGLLFKVVRSHEANPEDQQDLLQEAILQLWRSIPAYRGQCRETTWIYRVALNTALSWCRSQKRRRDRLQEAAALLERSEAAANSEDSIRRRSEIEALYKAIRQLPRADASLIVMHLDGLSCREIGEVLGISENNTAVRLSRARKQLAERLEGEKE